MQNKLRYSQLLVLLAFAMNVMLPFFATYNLPPSHAALEQLPAVFGEKLLICTGNSFKWVTLADLKSGREKPAPHSGDKCPLCYIAHHGLALSVAPPAAVLVHARIPASIAAGYQPFLTRLAQASPPQVRAPPFSSSL